ncbi:hypothetical protein BDP81DRAFT_423842 [Colletotrichum phormii]|uniref:Uncharacterized protein n=1 Tax=Colletotrichum phormii TaxID=359342 RepID=A0AAI9ZYP9_9PEZI|nr:uncharacterized protein BDP81DRAFT_423842 [Colletotrichum phormii]KAK1639284.1 hypothetical protein BDP81DRAFT_423842 [Colletotrichum phormii]
MKGTKHTHVVTKAELTRRRKISGTPREISYDSDKVQAYMLDLYRFMETVKGLKPETAACEY